MNSSTHKTSSSFLTMSRKCTNHAQCTLPKKHYSDSKSTSTSLLLLLKDTTQQRKQQRPISVCFLRRRNLNLQPPALEGISEHRIDNFFFFTFGILQFLDTRFIMLTLNIGSFYTYTFYTVISIESPCSMRALIVMSYFITNHTIIRMVVTLIILVFWTYTCV